MPHESWYETGTSGDFQAHATAAGEIIVEVPRDEKGELVIPGLKQLIYTWNGETYVLVNWPQRKE